MTPPEVPAEVRALLRETIASHEELAILLCLRRDRARALTADALAEAVTIAPGEAREAVERLTRLKLLSADGTPPAFRYAPEDPATASAIASLAAFYEARPIEVLRLMSSYSVNRLRLSAVTSFADAFLVGRKKDG